MKNTFLITLFTSLFFLSYSQDFDETKLDSKAQIKYSDTLSDIEERLSGKWKYLGKNTNGLLIDTVQVLKKNNKKHIIIVENGIVIETVGDKRKKLDYFYEATYNFKDGEKFYSYEVNYINKDISIISSCLPIPKLVYYNEKFGVLLTGLWGQYFEPIRELNNNYLILENGEEYIKIE